MDRCTGEVAFPQGWKAGICQAFHPCGLPCLSSHRNLMVQALFKALTGKRLCWVNTEHCNEIKMCFPHSVKEGKYHLSSPTLPMATFLLQLGRCCKFPKWNRLCQTPAQMAHLKKSLVVYLISPKERPYVGRCPLILSQWDFHMPLLLWRASLHTKPLIPLCVVSFQYISILLILDISRTGCHYPYSTLMVSNSSIPSQVQTSTDLCVMSMCRWDCRSQWVAFAWVKVTTLD